MNSQHSKLSPNRRAFDSSVLPSAWTAACLPNAAAISKESHDFFLKHWPFPDEKSRQNFSAQDMPGWSCWAYPKALPGRQLAGINMVVYLFLLYDAVNNMPLAKGKAILDKLRQITKGEVKADRSNPIEYLLHDLWEELRAIDKVLSDRVEEACFAFWNLQADPTHLVPRGLRAYLDRRQIDDGSHMLITIQCFLMGNYVSESDLAIVADLERNYSNHLTVARDILSFDKDLRDSMRNNTEGATLVNAVAVLAHDASLSVEASKRSLWYMCREWEARHEAIVEDWVKGGCSEALLAYAEGIKMQLAGNEVWCRDTPRYRDSEQVEAWL